MEDILLTNFTIEELKVKILHKPFEPFKIWGIPVFMNTETTLFQGELFKKHPDISLPFEVSNFGRIKVDGKILLQYPDIGKKQEDDPYGYLKIWYNNSWYEEYVYRLVAKTWCENPNPELYKIVHHISNNGMDNRKENLMWVTKAQHDEIHNFMESRKGRNM